ncbi:hypothetical protein D3C79_812100 [compost metagenome]
MLPIVEQGENGERERDSQPRLAGLQDNGEDAKQYYAEHYPQVDRSQLPERRCEQQDHEEQETGARYQRTMLGITVVEVDSGSIQTRLENGEESRVITEGEYDAGTECQQHDEDAPRFPL